MGFNSGFKGLITNKHFSKKRAHNLEIMTVRIQNFRRSKMSAIRENLSDGDKKCYISYLLKFSINFNSIKFMHKLYSGFFSEF